ncbi:hypothetical protein [Gymnodinialimonas sp.]
MLSKPLLATLLAVAPSGLWAFEAMDCIGTEICTANVGCTDGITNITLDFDWPDEAIIVALDAAEPQRQEVVGNSFDADAMSGVLSYRGDGQAALLLAFREGRITLTYLPGGDTSYRGNCTAREAA